jgi:2-keto-4-pentenoate hydratase
LPSINDPVVIADRFLAARRSASALADFPGDFPATLDEAYRIQDEAIIRWNRPIIGWKVGRVLPPLSGRFGTDRLAGPIFSEQAAFVDSEAATMPVFAAGFAAAEAEFLLRIGSTVLPEQREYSIEEAAAFIDAVHVGIEIASSPLGSINELGPTAVVADFGNNNGLVVGPAVSDWRQSGFETWPVAASIDGELAGSGRAVDFPAGALGSVRFLLELLGSRGIALERGQWISSGAVTGVHEVRPGQTVEAEFGDRLVVRACIEAARPERG